MIFFYVYSLKKDIWLVNLIIWMASPNFTRFFLFPQHLLNSKIYFIYFVVVIHVSLFIYHLGFLYSELTIISWSTRENPKLIIAHCCAHAISLRIEYGITFSLWFLLIWMEKLVGKFSETNFNVQLQFH